MTGKEKGSRKEPTYVRV